MKNRTCRTHTFTLVEIIAVLIILGILLAVAVPKYFSLVEEARGRAAAGAVAEVKSLCSIAYSKLVLQTGAPPATGGVAVAAEVATQLGTGGALGDYDITLGSTATTVTITATGARGKAVGTGGTYGPETWTLP